MMSKLLPHYLSCKTLSISKNNNNNNKSNNVEFFSAEYKMEEQSLWKPPDGSDPINQHTECVCVCFKSL